MVWNPPVVDEALGVRRSANVEAQRLMASLVSKSVQTFVFTKARVVAELIYRDVRDALQDEGAKGLAGRVRAYRGGYLPEERRKIENALFSSKPIEGLVGVRNLLSVMLPVLAMYDNRDVSGSVDSKNADAPTVFMYDHYPGGWNPRRLRIRRLPHAGACGGHLPPIASAGWQIHRPLAIM